MTGDRRSYCGRCGLRLVDAVEHDVPGDCIDALQEALRLRGRCSSCDRRMRVCAPCALKRRGVQKLAEAGGPLVSGITRALDQLLDLDDDDDEARR